MKPRLLRAMKAGPVVGLTIVIGSISGVTAAPARPAVAAVRKQAPIRIVLLYDLEGASGVLTEATMNDAKPDSFAVGRASLIDDVNAVIAGLFDGGATQIDVQNTHGAGGDTLVPRDRLDKRAGILGGARRFYEYALGPRPQQPRYDGEAPRPPYDAVVTVAMHDKPMSGGFSPHTIGAGISPIIDGRAVTETELIGYSFGTVGLPVIFSSGDDRLRATLATAMPWVEYTAVKRVTAPNNVEAIARDRVQRDLHDAAARAVRELGEPGHMRVMRLPAEFRAGLLPSYPLYLPPGLGTLPGFQKHGDTVTFLAKDYRSAYWAIFALQRIAAAFSSERTLREIAASADSAVFKRAIDSLWARWSAFEAAKWHPQ